MAMPELLTFAQAAAALGVHADDVRRWARTEQCPVVAVGRARRVPASWAYPRVPVTDCKLRRYVTEWEVETTDD